MAKKGKKQTGESPANRSILRITYGIALLFLALTTYYFYTGSMLGNLGPLLAVPGLIGLGALSLVSWRSTGQPKKVAAWLLALLCWAAALVSLPMGLVGLLSNFGIVFTV